MKRSLADITAAWSGDPERRRSRPPSIAVLSMRGFSPICPTPHQPFSLNDVVFEEHKSGIDMGRDLLRRLMCWWCAAVSPRKA